MKKPLDPRKEAVDWGNYIVLQVNEGNFWEMQRDFREGAFEEWMRKLATVKAGMSVGEVMKTFSIKEVPSAITFGCGTTYTFRLDDAYTVYGLFTFEGQLIEISKHPVAIIYEVYGDNEWPPVVNVKKAD